MSQKIFLNNKLVSPEQAVVNVYDHGLLYGDGIFEGIRIYNNTVFLLKEHLVRLYESAQAIRLVIPMSLEDMAKAVRETVAANGLKDGYIRLIVTRGGNQLGLDIRRTTNPQIIIIADKLSLYPAELYENGMPIITASTIRNHPQALSARIKSLNYLNNIMAKIEGTDAGMAEALMLNHKGEVSECTADNIFIVKNGELLTPPKDAGILDGITRQAILRLAKGDDIPAFERTLLRHDIYIADECFLTGTGAEVIPVTSLDGRMIGNGKPGPVTKRLLKLFRELTQAGKESWWA